MKLKIAFLILLSCFLFETGISGKKANKKVIITGHVTDNNGNPVDGAMILIDHKNTTFVTDDKGFYKVRVKPDAREISVFSFNSGAGEVFIDGRSVIDIVLNGTVPGEEVQANPFTGETTNIGYGTVTNENRTMNVNKIDASKKYYKGYNSIYDMIRGKVPGVTVVGKNIQIQGKDSFLGSTKPLLVVDGTTVQSIDNIIPQTVKSIEVLKGPAASIYGSRGANGVILIYLKRATDPDY